MSEKRTRRQATATPESEDRRTQPATTSESPARVGVFRRLAHETSLWVGSPYAFAGAVAVILVWAAMGPAFGFSDTWQLVINTGTTIVTFLMVFLIQNTQNRDARAVHLKLDELIHAAQGARNRLIDVEDLSDEELDRLQRQFERIRRARN